jgi:hypothetical protein
VRWKSIWGWVPLAVFVMSSGAGAALVAVDSGTSGAVLLIGAADGSQIGMAMLLAGTAAAIVALFQAAVLSTSIRRRWLRFIVRTLATLLIFAALPGGYLLLVMAGFSTVNSYRPLEVPGRSVVVQTTTWHHVSRTILEGEGLLFRPVVACGTLLIDGYDPFENGEYDTVARGGRDVLRFAQRPGGSLTGEAVLGLLPGEDASAFCASEEQRLTTRTR